MSGLNRRHFTLGCAATAALGCRTGRAASAITGASGSASVDSETARPDPLAIDDGRFVRIGGIDQWITMRGRNARNPVLLWLHGGPGFSMSSRAALFAPFESHYTVIQWDQPHSGYTYARNLNRDVGPLTLKRFVSDAREVLRFVQTALGVNRILVIGQSWGTQIGLTLAHESPELFSAYVGTGQSVSESRGGKLGYELALKAAGERHDMVAVKALEKVGPPPYSTLEAFAVRQRYTNPPGLPPSPAEQAHNKALQQIMSVPPPPNARYIPHDVPPFDATAAFVETQRIMFREVRKFEAASLGYRFRTPIYFFEGEYDINTPRQLVRDYFERIQAPHKAFRVIAGAGHNTLSFREEFLKLLDTDVRPYLA